MGRMEDISVLDSSWEQPQLSRWIIMVTVLEGFPNKYSSPELGP